MPNTLRRRPTVHLATTVVLAGALAGAGGAVAIGGERPSTPPRPPWTKSCVVEIRAHGDGSASLSCRDRTRPFAAVDSESGRIQFFSSR